MKPEQLLKTLIQFNTSNPPGNEYEEVTYINRLLEDAGIKTTILYKDPKRLNLIARVKGTGTSAPLLLYGHLDVVPAGNEAHWIHPPFQGKTADNCIWGRGALDMKSGITMMICALLKAVKEKKTFPGDVVLCLVCDEEEGGKYGAEFLVKNHASLFKDITIAISEFGGFSFYFGGKKFYLVQVAEKQICQIEIVFHGSSGHGALVGKDQAMYKMARFLNKLSTHNFPVHICRAAYLTFHGMAKGLSFPFNLLCRLLLHPAGAAFILKVLGNSGAFFQPLFRNMLNATIVRGGDKFNVVPARVSLQCDGRILPGTTPGQFTSQIQKLLGKDDTLNIIESQQTGNEMDLTFIPVLGSILKKMDPDGTVIPFLLPASTDARFFNRLGIQTYGFTPMDLPEDINFFRLIHGENERIPLKALEFGINAIYELLKMF